MAGVEWTEEAAKDLGKLDSQVRQRILRKIKWLSRNFEKVVPEPLSGKFKGTYKLRLGD